MGTSLAPAIGSSTRLVFPGRVPSETLRQIIHEPAHFARLLDHERTVQRGEQGRDPLQPLGAEPPRPAVNQSVIIEFRVDDVDREYENLKQFEIEFVNEPTTQPWGNRSLLFRDPDGNLVNFFTPVTSDALKRYEQEDRKVRGPAQLSSLPPCTEWSVRGGPRSPPRDAVRPGP